MDELIFPQPSPAPLILPRRLSTHGGGSNTGPRQKGRRLHIQQQQPIQPSNEEKTSDQQSRDNQYLGGNNLTHCFYYPNTPNSNTRSISPGDIVNPPAIFSFGNDKGMDGFVNPPADSVDPTYQPSVTTRRHSVATGSPWATVPPRHALHMPVMKVNPEIWRSENHQREIHRLMREGRDEEVMKRRDIQSVMDTISDDDEEQDMPGVVLTTDLGGFREAEEKEKARIQEEVRQEWARQVEYQNVRWRAQEFQRRKSWPNLLVHQQPVPYGQPGPGLQQSGLQQSGLQRIPDQLPAPGLQRRSSFGRYDNPVGGPSGENTRWGNGQFTNYRG
ncbi:hypothetical protein EMPS_09055 [Entomortierella parvispora]|uniref:Uncharacterized protein n=1 Tax=Entomortierella parvispora TaxID=205924 RepID=A0A9P3HHJ4_9FUNG|nr:hypothetical protein EMPS_09055 [Entomortierella parvispora]